MFTGNSDKMPFHVVEIGHVVIVSAHRGLGCYRLQVDEEDEGK